MDCAVYHNQFYLQSLDLALSITDWQRQGDIWHRSQMTGTAHCFRPIYNHLKVKKPTNLPLDPDPRERRLIDILRYLK